MRIVFIGDVHAGYRQYSSSVRAKDYIAALKSAVDKALEVKPACVIQVGDLFHTVRPSNAVLIEVAKQLGRLKRAGIEVYVIPGNHDFENIDVPPCKVLERMDVITKAVAASPISAGRSVVGTALEAITLGNARLIFARYMNRSEVKSTFNTLKAKIAELTDRDRLNILVTHLPIATGKWSRLVGISDSWIPVEKFRGTGLDVIVAGHIHDPEEYLVELPRLHFFYTGSLEWTDASEQMQKKILQIDIDKEQDSVRCRHMWHEIPVRPMVKLTSKQEVHNFVSELKNEEDPVRPVVFVKRELASDLKRLLTKHDITDRVLFVRLLHEGKASKESNLSFSKGSAIPAEEKKRILSEAIREAGLPESSLIYLKDAIEEISEADDREMSAQARNKLIKQVAEKLEDKLLTENLNLL